MVLIDKGPSSVVADVKSVSFPNRGRYFLLSLIIFTSLMHFWKDFTFGGTSVRNVSPPLNTTLDRSYESNISLFEAVKENNTQKVRFLLEDNDKSSRYDVNAEDQNGITPLIEATLIGNYDIVTLLLSHGARAQPLRGFRHTPLRAACLTANQKLIAFLLQNGADPNAKSEGMRTPLMGACFLRPEFDELPNREDLSKGAVKLMLEDSRTDPTEKNSFGESALDLCNQRGYTDSSNLLKNAIEKWNNDHLRTNN